jgi:hypothetical protein
VPKDLPTGNLTRQHPAVRLYPRFCLLIGWLTGCLKSVGEGSVKYASPEARFKPTCAVGTQNARHVCSLRAPANALMEETVRDWVPA